LLALARAGAAGDPGGRVSLKAELAARDDDRGAADLDALDLLRCAVHPDEELGRTADLRALRHLDFYAGLDATVPHEVDAERSARRPGRGILVDAARRREHPCLPVRSRTGEAVDPELRQASERTEVGLEGRDLFLAAELKEDVMRSEVVYLDGQLRAHAEQLLQLFRLFERLPVRYRLLHPAEHDARAFALEGDGNHTGLGLEPDLCELERSAEDERRAENGMPGEGQLHLRREDPDPRVPA